VYRAIYSRTAAAHGKHFSAIGHLMQAGKQVEGRQNCSFQLELIKSLKVKIVGKIESRRLLLSEKK
jgi:hypothetical protein